MAAVAALFVVMAALLYTGHLTRQVTNMLVPVAVYIVMAVSLNLVVGLLRAEVWATRASCPWTVLRVSGGDRAGDHRPAAGDAPAGEYAGGAA